jgi:(1->4)-alpha-D-glucan 1-alpha-D-glucosylmutase
LVGTYPIELRRIVAFAEKAARESKLQTSWTRPNAAYESGLRAFVAGVVDDGDVAAALSALLADVLPAARVSSLALALLKATAPGVPDIYQGSELLNESLVDPDNRRGLDVERCRRALLAVEALRASPEALLARMEEGLPKMHTLREAFALRARRPACFGAGDEGRYEPVLASGTQASHVVAYVRTGDGAPHRGRRPRDRVAAQIDGGAHPSCTRCARRIRARS